MHPNVVIDQRRHRPFATFLKSAMATNRLMAAIYFFTTDEKAGFDHKLNRQQKSGFAACLGADEFINDI